MYLSKSFRKIICATTGGSEQHKSLTGERKGKRRDVNAYSVNDIT